MAEERIKVVVYDEEINNLLFKLNQAGFGGSGGDDSTKRVRELNKQISDARKAAKAAGVNLDQLPTLNRNIRTIINTIPYMREVSQLLFRTRLGVQAAEKGREAGAVKDMAPELAKQLTLQSLLGYAALIVFITKMMYNAIKSEVERIERAQSAYEDLFRKELDLTHREYRELVSEQTGFATWRDQFQSEVESKGFGFASVDAAVDKIKSFVPTLSDSQKTWVERWIDAQQWYNVDAG